ncbi:O-antigen ligase family protein [Flavobacterium sp. ARAG 55.4]|uniref:O-antigen ligase family protein n=1 Tax=Flavobacterium sp. ARAG 55.4 TaxID=3451357 RepID=UPI003F47B7A7
MILEFFLIAVFLIYCNQASEKRILFLIFFLLPIHGTIKYVVFPTGGEIFAIWKELGILVLFLRTLRLKHFAYNKIFSLFLLFSIFIFGYTLIGFYNDYPISTSFKKLFFPVFLTLSVSKIQFTRSDARNFFLIILLGSLLINITGIIDFISPTMRVTFRSVLGASFQEGSDGTLYYDNSSLQIMGFDRVCGLMTGGPNQMGIFNSAILILGIFAWVGRLSFKFSHFQFIGLKICIGASAFCLLTSFSRAGWAILLITLFYTLIVDKGFRKFGLKYVFITLFFIISVVFSVPKFYFIIESTLSGKEASSAARGDMTIDALNYFLNNTLGKGIGSTDFAHTHLNTDLYFAESALINFGIELGLLGLLLLIGLQIKIGSLISNNISRNGFSNLGIGFLIAYLITSAVSVNTYENPFIYYAWMIFGLALNTKIFIKRNPRVRNNINNLK